MTVVSRLGNISQDVAIKAPVRAATTANVTLSGLQAIDGVTLLDGDRVLVKNQTDTTTNGIYQASSGNWIRTFDASKNTDFLFGTLVLVAAGATQSGAEFVQANTDNPVVIGTSLISFVPLANLLQAATSTTSSSSLAVGTGSKTFTVPAGLGFAVSQWVLAWQSNNLGNAMMGQITAYAGTSLTINSVTSFGSGTVANWTLALSNSPATIGIQLPGPQGAPGATGAPGVNGTAQNFDTVALATAATIGGGVNGVRTLGFASLGDGGAGTYVKLGSPPAPPKAWHFQSADAAWWQLVTDPVFPKQLGAKLDGSTDDTAALQAWHDYGVAFGVLSAGQLGTAIVTTGTINLASGANIDGRGLLTVQRNSNVDASLFDGNAQTKIRVKGIAFTTTAGFSSASSNTIGLTSQNYTVPAGLNLVVGQFVQITANSNNAAHVNYEIAQITAYSGTTLTVTATTAVGSGSFSAWLIDVYPLNGDLAASNIGLRFTACNDVIAERNSFVGRFYNALDARNCNDVIFTENLISGHVNRGIHMAAYIGPNSAANNQATFNRINGNFFSQYGINTSASDGAVAIGFLIAGNRIVNTTFQGIILAGGITFSEISTNSVQMAFNNSGVGIIVEQIVGTSTQQPQNIAVANNTIDLGAQGILVDNTTYSSFTGNTASGAGTGYLFNGVGVASVAYLTVSGNIAQGCVADGFDFNASVGGALTGLSINGNTSIGNGGFGFFSAANSTNCAIAGNVALANGTQYSIGGTGHIYSATFNK